MSKAIFREKWELWWKVKDIIWSEKSTQLHESSDHPTDTPVMFMVRLYDVHVNPQLISIRELGAYK